MIRPLPLLAACLVPLLATSCVGVADDFLTGMEAAAAKDQIMLVRETPPSFGYQRLVSRVRAHPDLGVFVNQRGLPDFLAETGSRDRQYMILYYLNDRQAFACRTKSARSRMVEFAGPYPITRHEFELLDGFRASAAQKRAAAR